MKYVSDKDQTLLEALASMAPDSSRSSLRSWLKQGRVLVDGNIQKIGSSSVKKGQTVSLKKKIRQAAIEILYSDPHIAVIDKPAGILSVKTHYETGKTAHAFLKDVHKPRKVYPVHRLDRETSGVMIFALTEEAKDNLKKQFETHSIVRQYYAIVDGRLEPQEGTWKSRLAENKNYEVYRTSNEKLGKIAITHYKVVKRTKKTTHLLLTLETGRKNQIRVHCQDVGHPVVGDKKYGPSLILFPRLCLHAKYLEFSHPTTGKRMKFNSPLPKEFDNA